ncbi:hypothetical protein [Flavobacterium pectinovorum]|uniref:hypothetical protein n=1 Tax=Flavobacterium pectinovorum TaxID=29533 RepID=UPI001FAD18D2|nr:hypothetical protein [Flavobacterium pectinovorum]MCI9844080.1 hypothetical protein [Flavobacterium pectinovorum]
MRIFIIIGLLLLLGCESPKKKYDFTFFKWNIRESYYLKFNSSDTLYYVDVYGYKEETSFAILNKDEKERIENILDTITFLKEEVFDNNMIEDGQTYAFLLKNDKQSRKLKIHGRNGPTQFWMFGESLEKIKDNHTFIKMNKKINLREINKMVIMPLPPNFKVDID